MSVLAGYRWRRPWRFWALYRHSGVSHMRLSRISFASTGRQGDAPEPCSWWARRQPAALTSSTWASVARSSVETRGSPMGGRSGELDVVRALAGFGAVFGFLYTQGMCQNMNV